MIINELGDRWHRANIVTNRALYVGNPVVAGPTEVAYDGGEGCSAVCCRTI